MKTIIVYTVLRSKKVGGIFLMLKRIFNRKHRRVTGSKLQQFVPFEEKPYLKSELDGFLNPTNKKETTDFIKYFIY